MSTTPCATCPWRVGSSAADIPSFDIEKARGLRCTAGRTDEFRTIMACHGSPVGEEHPCVGYLAIYGWSNLSVRMLIIRGKIDMEAIIRDCEGIELYDTFGAMLANLEDTHVHGG